MDVSRTFALAARDLVAMVAARDTFARHLDEFARRRAARYAAPEGSPPGDGYFIELAAAMAPVLPSELVPMWGLPEAGITLEGGARGLRSLFSSTPSERERRRVQRTAGLAWRVLALAGKGHGGPGDDEKRLQDMAMAAFGLLPEELAAARGEPPARAGQLEVYGELDAKVRRELVRGAWQVALQAPLTPAAEDEVLTLAAKLEVSPELDALRREVVEANARLGRVATRAVELVRGVAGTLPPEGLAEALEHLVRAAAPPGLAPALRARFAAGATDLAEPSSSLVGPQCVQAFALAWATVKGLDLAASRECAVRAELRAAAAEAREVSECHAAMEIVDAYLLERVVEVARRPSGS